MGGGGLTGAGEAPLLTAPTGPGPGPFGGTGMPQHLPEVVWPPLPLVLRIRHAPRFWNPLQDFRPTGRPAPSAPNPGAPVVPELPPSAAGVMGPLLSTAPLGPRGGREGTGRRAQISPPWQGEGEVGFEGGRVEGGGQEGLSRWLDQSRTGTCSFGDSGRPRGPTLGAGVGASSPMWRPRPSCCPRSLQGDSCVASQLPAPSLWSHAPGHLGYPPARLLASRPLTTPGNLFPNPKFSGP